jgi:ankyrin repeat protein
VDVLDLLLKSGADVNERVPFTLEDGEMLDEETKRKHCSESPLHLAVRSNVPKAVLWLVENGANTSIRDAKGLTALDYARKSNNNAMLEALKPFL